MDWLQSIFLENRDAIIVLAGFSLLAFLVSIIALPILIIRLPADYFIRPVPVSYRHPVLHLVLKILKNTLGLILLILGFGMLFIPGQGILTMLVGMALMDFPGKWELQRRIVRSPRVHRSLDWLRQKTDKPLFILPDR